MLCERCKKNEATFHKSVYINGKGYETNLCSKCANELNLNSDFDINTFNLDLTDFDSPFGLNNRFLGEFFEDDDFFTPTMLLEKNTKKCPNCKSTFSDFLRTGKLGCNECYDTFQDEIRDMLENMENPTDFKLEIDSELSKIQPTKLEQLTADFNKAIEEERYEDAGKLKQEINELNKDKDDLKENK